MKGIFWKKGSGKRLRGNKNAQLVALYLMTCEQGTMCGIFHIALPTIAHETGLTIEEVTVSLQAIEREELAYYDDDDELVWIPNSAREQIGEELRPGDNRRKGLEAELAQFKKHRFYAEFIEKYQEAYGLLGSSSRAATKPPRRGSEWASKPRVQEQEQEQAQVQDQGTEQDQVPGDPPTVTAEDRAALAACPTPGLEPLDVCAEPSPDVDVFSAAFRPLEPSKRRVPSSFAEAMKVPVQERARILLRYGDHQLATCEAQRWPEVVALVQSLCRAMTWREPSLRTFNQTAKRMVEALAEFDAEELERAIDVGKSDKWFADKTHAHFSETVISSFLNKKSEAPTLETAWTN